MKPRQSPSSLCGSARRSTDRPRWSARPCSPPRSYSRGANMLDRRINKLKENLLRQAAEAPPVRHLLDANPRGADMLGGGCPAPALLPPSAAFPQTLHLVRAMSATAYISDTP